MKTESVSTLLGLTQNELAILLNVSRPLVTLYESGLRSLPLHATQRLAELLAQIQTQPAKRTAKQTANNPPQAYLNKLLHENEYQRLLTTRKIAALERKLLKQERLSHLADVLKNESKNVTPSPGTLAIQAKAVKASGTNQDFELSKLNLKLELLNHEKQFLESKLLTTVREK